MNEPTLGFNHCSATMSSPLSSPSAEVHFATDTKITVPNSVSLTFPAAFFVTCTTFFSDTCIKCSVSPHEYASFGSNWLWFPFVGAPDETLGNHASVPLTRHRDFTPSSYSR